MDKQVNDAIKNSTQHYQEVLALKLGNKETIPLKAKWCKY